MMLTLGLVADGGILSILIWKGTLNIFLCGKFEKKIVLFNNYPAVSNTYNEEESIVCSFKVWLIFTKCQICIHIIG